MIIDSIVIIFHCGLLFLTFFWCVPKEYSYLAFGFYQTPCNHYNRLSRWKIPATALPLHINESAEHPLHRNNCTNSEFVSVSNPISSHFFPDSYSLSLLPEATKFSERKATFATEMTNANSKSTIKDLNHNFFPWQMNPNVWYSMLCNRLLIMGRMQWF